MARPDLHLQRGSPVRPPPRTPPGSRGIFDTDNIDIGPERRAYLDHQLSRVWEYNDEVSG